MIERWNPNNFSGWQYQGEVISRNQVPIHHGNLVVMYLKQDFLLIHLSVQFFFNIQILKYVPSVARAGTFRVALGWKKLFPLRPRKTPFCHHLGPLISRVGKGWRFCFVLKSMGLKLHFIGQNKTEFILNILLCSITGQADIPHGNKNYFSDVKTELSWKKKTKGKHPRMFFFLLSWQHIRSCSI